MKACTEYIVAGSVYFFWQYDDFHSKDIDYIQLVDTNKFVHSRHTHETGMCLFQIRRKNCVDDYIKRALKAPSGMVIGMFLIPQFCNAIGFKIEHLPELRPLIEKLDNKHKYEEIIFNSYIENGDFILTQKQRDLAYQSYKQTRRI